MYSVGALTWANKITKDQRMKPMDCFSIVNLSMKLHTGSLPHMGTGTIWQHALRQLLDETLSAELERKSDAEFLLSPQEMTSSSQCTAQNWKLLVWPPESWMSW